MADFVLSPASAASARRWLGGKGARLWDLSRAGLPVPAWVALSSRVFAEVLTPLEPALNALLAASPSPEQEDALTQLLQELKLPPQVLPALLAALPPSPSGRYAVRSSAQGEDGAKQAFAGIFGTWLDTPAAALEARILACWRESFGAAARGYLAAHGLSASAVEMAVIVQVQLVPDAAGVLFQAAPDGQLNDQVMVAGYGLGEGVVDGSVATDTYRCDRFSGQWELQIGHKTQALFSSPQGPQLGTVPPAQQEVAVLNLAEREALLKLGAQVQALGGGFQDIEWCRADGQLYLLQSRPITTLPAGPYQAFDCSNIQESYPGRILPLTASLVERGYATNFASALRLLGFSPRFMAAQRPVLWALTAQIEGRLYYHLQHWYTVLGWLPGMRRRALAAFGAMISRAETQPQGRHSQSPLRALWIGGHVVWRLLSLRAAMAHTQQQFEAAYRKLASLEIGQMEAPEILRVYDQACDTFLPLAAVPLLNDLWTGLLLSGLRRSLLALPDTVAPDARLHALLGALPSLASSEPLQALDRLAESLRDRPQDLQHLQALPLPEAWQLIQQDPHWHSLKTGLAAYLEDYGARSLQELKLEQPSFYEAPTELLHLLLMQAQQPPQAGSPSRAAYTAALAEVGLHWPRWHPGWWLLRQTREALSRRELGRLNRTRLMGQARRLLLAVGARLARSGALPQPEMIHFLRQDDLLAWLGAPDHPTDTPSTLPPALQTRLIRAQQDHASWAERTPRERLLLCADPAQWRVAQQSRRLPDGPLAGQGCAGGVVEGEVLVLHAPRPDAEVSGKILVTPLTDPGWVFLMARAAGLIVERGNLLSHAAIMARELGLPTVVGVTGATRLLQTGERVRLDGQTGAIERLPLMAE
ncbi:MAG: PEP/pyruvate-binding domain-containing protein [Candidatus Sericytochromatia bacterium]